MKPRCPKETPDYAHQVIRKGYFWSKNQSKWIPRFWCRACRVSFSRSTMNPCFRQKKRRLNPMIKKLLCSKNSQRRTAKILGIHRTTVARKLKFLAEQARLSQKAFLEQLSEKSFLNVWFDEMETHENTNCKPLSIALIVNKDRKILGFEVSRFRPKTRRLAEISLRKYGYRRDERRSGLDSLLSTLRPFVSRTERIVSDMNPFYPAVVKKHFPESFHEIHRSRRAAVAGQGELKEKGFDPLFPLNHTCAMIRDGVGRLVRKTWCTTKKIQALEDHLALYVDFHNRVLTN